MHQNILPKQPDFPSALPEKMKESLASFAMLTGVPITFFDEAMHIQWECLPQQKICSHFPIYHTPGSLCLGNLTSSAQLASQLGEPYVFVCRAGFVKIVVSVIIGGKTLGCFMAGPVAMGSIRPSVIENICKLNAMTPQLYSAVTLFLRQMKCFEPKEVSALANLLEASVLSSLSTPADYRHMKHRFKEQSDIGESLQRYKRQRKPIQYPYQVETELIKKIKTGDALEAKALLQVLLNEISIIESGNLPFVRTKIFELCAILSRETMESDNTFHDFFDLHADTVSALNEVDNFTDLAALVTKLLDGYAQMQGSKLYEGHSAVISQAVVYIHENYTNKLSLKQISEHLHINQSYFSTLFKQEMGATFTDYLNHVRVKRSQHFLLNTKLSLVEVAFHSGFEDQSYFTKVFKKTVGCTPKLFRKRNGIVEPAVTKYT